MEGKDLRIDNLINHQVFGVVSVTGIMNKGEIITFNGATVGYAIAKLFQPIMLTKEWLEKFGITIKDDNPKQKKRYEGDVLFFIGNIEFSNSDKGQNGGFYSWSINEGKTIFKYVHQFQNWHYYHFEQELKVNSEKTANIE